MRGKSTGQHFTINCFLAFDFGPWTNKITTAHFAGWLKKRNILVGARNKVAF